jgi:hypothetical protein
MILMIRNASAGGLTACASSSTSFQLISLPAEEVNLDDQEEDDSGGALASIYRLPPFGEAPRSNQNQVGSPPPLPIPLRIPYPHDYFGDLGPNNAVEWPTSFTPIFSVRSVLCFGSRGSHFPFRYCRFIYWGLPVAPTTETSRFTKGARWLSFSSFIALYTALLV